MNLLRKLTLSCCFLGMLYGAHHPALAQINTYQEANRLFEEQNFEEALPLFEELSQNNPRSLIFFERYVDSLIGLRKLEEAKSVASYHAGRDAFPLQASVTLSELYHLSGETETAVERWLQDASENLLNMQAIYYIGNSATERNEYETAIRIYEMANESAGDNTLFLNEIANNYMLAGDFEKSVQVYFRLITESPEQMPFVQQRFLRIRDPDLYEIAAFELEEVLLELGHSHAAYTPMYQLLIWLLIETGEFSRSYHVARQFENNTPYDNYALFSLGNQLRSAHQFELAAQSYRYYSENGSPALQARALEELGNTHREWALHASQNQILDVYKIEEITSDAYRYYEELIESFPDYPRLESALTSIIDLSLDAFKSAEKAELWFHKLQNPELQHSDAYIWYAEGRLALFRSDFTQARQLLTRADRASDDSNLSERSRFYISLSDIFAADFEFAEIQLRSLEQRSTSFYANEAIRLRMWISNGLRADTTGGRLTTISRGLHALHAGHFEQAITELEPVLSDPSAPLRDDLLVELKKEAPPSWYPYLFRHLQETISQQRGSPLRERLIWDAITLAIYFNEYESGPEPVPGDDEITRLGEQANRSIETYAEIILMEFPDGFYAPYIRDMLRNRSDVNI